MRLAVRILVQQVRDVVAGRSLRDGAELRIAIRRLLDTPQVPPLTNGERAELEHALRQLPPPPELVGPGRK